MTHMERRVNQPEAGQQEKRGLKIKRETAEKWTPRLIYGAVGLMALGYGINGLRPILEALFGGK